MAFVEVGNPIGRAQNSFSAVARTALFYKVPLVASEDIAFEFGGNIDDTSKGGSIENIINNDLFREIGFDELTKNKVNSNELFFYSHPEKTLKKLT